MNLRNIERNIIFATRYLTMLAVIGSLAGSLLMFVLGLKNIYQALRYWVPSETAKHLQVAPEAASIISVIEGLDRFLIAIVLLYFSYGVYSLFIRPDEPEPNLSLPAWLRVKQIGQLKQVVAEVIIVILFVLFLRLALQAFHNPDVLMSWQQIATLLVIPVCTTLLAVALRLVKLHPKSTRSERVEDDEL
ncbi:MAG: YqhA family protein [Candidatus Competibacteraceae bacterium]|jgi:uncharacterized membrane protein YqhA|nr:YqhA family protein [Candidatus Competibacteraceae bacterium]